uniref:Chromo domain-containing protein n=1 Tax=Rhabditophanes sp. KR3021 TaxID=114890 RepID=A0AC35U820_9BILA
MESDSSSEGWDIQVVYKVLRTRRRDHDLQALVWWENCARKDANWEYVDNNLDNNIQFINHVARNKKILERTNNKLIRKNLTILSKKRGRPSNKNTQGLGSTSEESETRNSPKKETVAVVQIFTGKRLRAGEIRQFISHKREDDQIYFLILIKDGRNLWIKKDQFPGDFLESYSKYMVKIEEGCF